jgi:hypothetical protein
VNEPLQVTLADAAAFLEKEGIAYALVGGMAVSLRGQPRVTADVDMVIAIDVDRALALVGRLGQSKFQPLFDGIEEVIERAFILPLRHRSTHVKLDLAIGLSGFERQSIARAQPVEVAGSQISVATAEDLLVMKVLAGRPQDEQDIAGLVNAQGERLDWDYCLAVATELGESLGQDLAGRINALRSDSHN